MQASSNMRVQEEAYLAKSRGGARLVVRRELQLESGSRKRASIYIRVMSPKAATTSIH
jgi:hypothetical protein